VVELWRADDDHVRYLDRGTRRLMEQATGGGAATVIAEDVRSAAGREHVTVVDQSTQLRLITAETTRVLVNHATNLGGAVVAIAPDGGELAAAIDDEIITWRAATGRELQRWSARRVSALFRGPTCWFVVGHDGAATLSSLPSVSGARPSELLRGEWAGGWVTPAAHAIGFAANEGTLALIDATGLHLLSDHKPGVRAIAGRADRPYVAVAYSDGTILWWRVADVAPPPHAIGGSSELIGADRTASFALDHDEMQIVAFDRGSDARRPIGDGPILFAGPIDRAGHIVAMRIEGHQPRPALLDAATRTARGFPDGALVVADRASGQALFSHGREVAVPGSGGDRVVATGPGAIVMVAVADGWGAAVSEAAGVWTLLRIDLAHARTRTLALWAAPDHLMAAADGTLWWSFDRALWSWNGRWLARVELPSPVITLVASGRGVAVVLLDHSIWLASPDAVTNRLASGDQRTLVFGDRSVVAVEGNDRLRVVLATGERTRWRSEGMQTSIAIGDDDRRIDVQSHGRERDWLTSYEDRVPADPLGLRIWLAQATDAVIDGATGALVWPDRAMR
jgi:hypothetical protein